MGSALTTSRRFGSSHSRWSAVDVRGTTRLTRPAIGDVLNHDNNLLPVVQTPKAGLVFRPMNVQELGEEYRNKTDKELLRLALTPEQLTPEANAALTSELARRRIDSGPHLDAARQEEEERKAENERSLGTLGFIPHFGAGRMRFGKSDRVYDSKTGLEQFRTTVFVVLFFFPLIPTGTYLVERKRAVPDELTGLRKLPLDWEQVLRVWVVAAGSILALIWLIKLVSSETVWRLVHRR